MSRMRRFDWIARRSGFRSKSASRHDRRLRVEALEERQMLAITVDTLVDEMDGDIGDGDISLRDAITAATAGETIDFAVTGTIDLTLGELTVDKDLIIDGPGAASLTIDAGDGLDNIFNTGDGYRIFNIDVNSSTKIDVELRGLTLTGGDVDGIGGAIRSRENLTLVDSVVRDNAATSLSGGIHNLGDLLTITRTTVSGNSSDRGGGIFSNGTTTITESALSGNTATRKGGGIEAFGTLNIVQSTISGNTAGSLYGGGIHTSGSGTTTISQSTISDNSAGSFGGGIYTGSDTIITQSTISGNTSGASGGGVFAALSNFLTLTVLNSTISGNSANSDGGGVSANGFYYYGYYGGDNTSATTIRHTTITGNTSDADSNGSGSGGGLYLFENSEITLDHTIVAANTDNASVAPDLLWSGTSTLSFTYSLIGDNRGSSQAETTDNNLIGGPIGGVIDPLLAALAGNGGPTETHELLPDSPAVDAGGTTSLLFDQRGAPYPRMTDGDGDFMSRVDIGAVEALGLQNPSYEEGGGSLVAWTPQNNAVLNNAMAFEGTNSARLGESPLGFSVLFQGVPIQGGETLVASVETLVAAADPIGTGNFGELKLEFYSVFGGIFGSGDYLGEEVVITADDTTATDTWQQTTLQATAPVGAVEARVTVTFVGSNSGAVYYDAASLHEALVVDMGSIGDTVWFDLDGDGVQESGEPGVEGIEVLLLDESDNILQGTFTDSLGAYEFLGVIAGTFQVEVKPSLGLVLTSPDQGANDELDSDFDPVTGRASVTLAGNQADRSIDAGLTAVTGQAVISGLAWFDLDSDGVRFLQEPLLEGTRVTLFDAAGAVQLASTTTDALGQYAFTGLLPDTYVVEFQADDGLEFSPQDQGGDDSRDSDVGADGRRTVTLDAAEEITNLDAGQVVVPELGSVGDRVWLDTNANGLQDSGEPGVADVTVHLFDATDGQLIASMQTGSDGEFLFAGLAAAEYTLDVDPPPAYTISPPDLTDDARDSDPEQELGRYTFTLGAGEVNIDIDAGLIYSPALATSESLVTVSGQVWNDLNNDGVRDVGEPPLANISVYASRPRARTQVVRTGENGEYEFVNLRSEAHEIRFIAPFGYNFVAQDQGADDAIDSDVPVSGRITVDLAATGSVADLDAGLNYIGSSSISGRVWDDQNGDGIRDPGERDVSGVVVLLIDANTRRTLTSTWVDSNGTYLFSGVPAGDYILRFYQRNASFEFSPVNSGADDTIDSDVDARGNVTLTMASNEEVTSVDAGLVYVSAGSAITGRVWRDYNGDGFQGQASPGFASIAVTLKDTRGRVVAPRVFTQSDGSYRFSSLRPGTYQVEFRPRGGYDLSPANIGNDDTQDSDPSQVTGRATVTVGTDEIVSNVDAGLTQDVKASIGGFVWYDKDSDGIQDSPLRGERGVPSIEVYLLDASGRVVLQRVRTNRLGNYQFAGLDAGNYVVKVVRRNTTEFSLSNQGNDDELDSDVNALGKVPVSVAEGEAIRSIDAGLQRRQSTTPTPSVSVIGDRVWEDRNGNGSQDSWERGLRGVKVGLFDSTGTQLMSLTTTDSFGRYRFINKPAGDYVVKVRPPSGFEFTTKDQGGNLTDSDFDPSTGAADVTLATSGSRVSSIDAGLVRIPIGSIRGEVFWDVDRDGVNDPNDGVFGGVGVWLLDSTGMRKLDLAITNGFGSYLFSSLAPGTYQVQFSVPFGYELSPSGQGPAETDSDPNPVTRRVIVTVNAGESLTNIDAGLVVLVTSPPLDDPDPPLPTHSIGNRVWIDADRDGIQDPGERGKKGVTIHLLDTNDNLLLSTKSDRNGNYQFTGLPQGDYKIRVEQPSGFKFSPTNVGNREGKDSDVGRRGKARVTTTDNTRRNVDIGVYRGTATIGNFVWDDRDGDGIQDVGEPGLEGVDVLLWDATGTDLLATTTSDALGGYSFDFSGDDGAGDYFVEFITPIGYRLTAADQGGDDARDSDPDPVDHRVAVTLLAEQVLLGIDAGFFLDTDAGRGTISDLVWNDLNQDGLQNPAEPGIDGVVVRLRAPDSVVVLATTTTRNGGQYAFQSLSPGNYQLQFTVPAAFDISPVDQGGDDSLDSDADPLTGEVDVVVVADMRNTDIDVGLFQRTTGDAGSIGSRVWEDQNRDGIQDAAEPGLAGVELQLLEAASATIVQTTNTDRDGSYQFLGLAAGNYIVQVLPFGGYEVGSKDATGDDTLDNDADPDTEETDTVTLAADEQNDTIDIGLVQQLAADADIGLISDRIWRDSNENGIQDVSEPGLADITVRLLEEDAGLVLATTLTDTSGQYRFAGLSAGNYLIEVIAPTGFRYSPQDQGDDTTDSDVDPTTGRTAVFTLAEDQLLDTVDGGLVLAPPLTVFVNPTYDGFISGADPDGAGPLLALGLDAFPGLNEAASSIDRLLDSTVVDVAPGSYDPTLLSAPGRRMTVDARAVGITVASIAIDGGTMLIVGELSVPGGVQINAGGMFGGTGDLSGTVSADSGSTITATGNLTLGDAEAFDGFVSTGSLFVNEYEVIILDRDSAVLGPLTELGSTSGPGIIRAPNGLLLPSSNTLTGYGLVAGPFENQGETVAEGPQSNDEIAFSGPVSGAGDFAGNIRFTDNYSPGNGPAAVGFASNVVWESDATLEIDIDGISPGTGFDTLNITETASLDGTVQFNVGSSPKVGDAFTIMTFDSASGNFSNYVGLDLGNGLALVPNLGENSLTLVTESFIVGDMDRDGDVDFDDIDDFILGLSTPSVYEGTYGVPPTTNGDADGDSDVDFDDINGFIANLNGGSLASEFQADTGVAASNLTSMPDAGGIRGSDAVADTAKRSAEVVLTGWWIDDLSSGPSNETPRFPSARSSVSAGDLPSTTETHGGFILAERKMGKRDVDRFSDAFWSSRSVRETLSRQELAELWSDRHDWLADARHR
ncbi:MAG: SdrD B-like domain-containing protein [Pirellulales bacterium]